MDYFNSNNYSNYPYGNNNRFINPGSNYYGGNAPMMQPQMQVQTPQIPGKIVDAMDTVRVMDIPIGGYGVYPKADLSEIYVKTWNREGTGTSVISYKPCMPEPIKEPISAAKLSERMDSLESKIEQLLSNQTSNATQEVRKGVAANAF